MVNCPKCGNTIPTRRLILLTNISTLTCPACSSILQVKNRNFASIIGASGALMEMLVFSILSLLHFELLTILFWMVAFIPVGFIIVMLPWTKYVQLKARS